MLPDDLNMAVKKCKSAEHLGGEELGNMLAYLYGYTEGLEEFGVSVEDQTDCI